MSIIEQAARRLEELRRSGIEIPPRNAASTGHKAAARLADDLPARAIRRLDESSVSPLVRERATAPVHEVPERSAEPVQSKLAHIDLARLIGMGYLTPQTPRAQIADEFRVIKRPLLTNLQGGSAVPEDKASLIMVTSSLAGEGKTFVAINLAISLAMEMDKSVLLVDADVARPSVLSRLGLRGSVGLLDRLADPSIKMSDILLRTNIDKLTILPAGASRGHATEMLASDAMGNLLAEMASRYEDRIIVFDTPPLLPSPESRVLATRMGQVVLVVESERTPQKTALQALAAIDSCPVVMPLLNKSTRSEIGFYYGYYGPTEGQ